MRKSIAHFLDGNANAEIMHTRTPNEILSEKVEYADSVEELFLGLTESEANNVMDIINQIKSTKQSFPRANTGVSEFDNMSTPNFRTETLI